MGVSSIHYMSRFATLSAKSRAHLQAPAAQPTQNPVTHSPLTLSRFATLSDKSRAAMARPRPAQTASPPVTPSSGISVDEAWLLFGITKKRASQEEVKGRYLKLVAKYHPDKNPNDQRTATDQMIRVNLAYAALKRHCKW